MSKRAKGLIRRGYDWICEKARQSSKVIATAVAVGTTTIGAAIVRADPVDVTVASPIDLATAATSMVAALAIIVGGVVSGIIGFMIVRAAVKWLRGVK